MIRCAFTYYPPGGEHTEWFEFPAVPNVGDTVHFPVLTHDDETDSMAMRVRHVSWAPDECGNGWHPEITLGV